MAFNPASPYGFNYEQTIPLASQTIVFTYTSVGYPILAINNVSAIGFPVWLQLINTFSNISQNTITFTLKVDENYAFNMAEGDYLAENIRLKYTATVSLPSGPTDIPYYTTFFNVDLNVQHITVLSITPSQLPFSYTIGNALPQTKTLTIQSDSNWTIEPSQTWVTLSTSNGIDNAIVVVGVDPVGLSIGDYSALLEVTDNGDTRYATVTLNVLAENQASEFLVVTPNLTTFLSILGEENTTEKTINIDASDAWTLTNNASWLNTSVTSGASGLSTLTLTVDSEDLTVTTISYLGVLTFSSLDIVKTIYIELRILNFITQGMESETLYYADDRNRYEVTNIDSNTFLLLKASVSDASNYTLLKYSIPYHQGLASALFGMETNYLLKSVPPTNVLTTRIKNNFAPILYTYQAINKGQYTNAETIINQYNNLRFLKGKTPTVAQKLCYIPDDVTLDASSVISLSVQSSDAITDIVVTGDYTGTFTTSIAANLYTYNAILNLAPLDLQPGDVINVAFGNISLDVTIDETAIEINTLAFQNEWNEFEFFTTKGFLTIEDSASKTETQVQNDGEVQTKITAIDHSKNYTLYSGWLHTQAEANWLAMILKSKLIYLYVDGEPVEIILETTKLEVYQTRENLKSYQLKFKKAITE